ncbi:transglycosylase domain-containing protein [Hymenobacter weizhouensis]|uniref:transglycosylase domain-containing protein n=1 Tax=Hymenobacter sp. YIM 151500-1 TaxID=2987689 RepID=UPI002227F2F4|nr:transglycosylase domain-containing protein [Hymenobacter sp. YIM 151500-1]UYZ63477.1 transglycosylase domain-containing protein [Hymenobacter sp. YIM 151500-1]
MTSATKRKIGIGLGILAALLLLGLGVFLFKRQQLLDAALQQVKAKVERKYPVVLTLGPARFTDLNTVQLDGMSMVPRATPTDTLLRTQGVRASLSVRSLFAGRPVFSNLEIDNARLSARKNAAGQDNYSFLIQKKKQPTVRRDTTKGTNYGLLANQLLEATFDNIPDEADFQNFLVTYQSPRHQARLTMPRLSIEDGDISGQLTAVVDSVENRVGVQGRIDAGDYEVDARVFGLNRRPVVLPYVQRRYGARVQFDTIRVSLTEKDLSGGDELTVKGTASAANFIVNHPKLSDSDVRFPRGGIDFVARLGQASFALEKGTRVLLNKMEFFPEVSVRRLPVPERIIGKNINGLTNRNQLLAGVQLKLQVESGETKANDFFASLPEGMFETLEGTQGEGTLKYRLAAELDMNKLDSLKFNSGLQATKFRITRFGREDLSKLNQEFPVTVYNDKGDSVKTILVGPSNPEFTPYNEVSDYLKAAIMTAEDPRFLTHRGFMEKAFVKSAIQNIKERRFARGGSTISMQLVKNVFLTRKKTIVRKAEEALIVWIIENTRLVSKERMFEVYLNIIEWGPKIYGVHEASEFYFDKRPTNLTLTESLYLASIIPKPKYYRYSFNQYGELRGSARYFYRLIAGLMARKGLISQDDYDNLGYAINLDGPARRFIVTATRDTVRTVSPADSAQFEPLNLIDLLGGQTAPDAGANQEVQPPTPPAGNEPPAKP